MWDKRKRGQDPLSAKKTWKRVLAAILCAAMVPAMMPGIADAAQRGNTEADGTELQGQPVQASGNAASSAEKGKASQGQKDGNGKASWDQGDKDGQASREQQDGSGQEIADAGTISETGPEDREKVSLALQQSLEETADLVLPEGTIAVLDSGMPENSHVISRVSMLGDEGLDENGHGSLVLDWILDENPNAQVLSIKVLDAGGEGNASAVSAGLRYAMEKGASMVLLPVSSGRSGNEALEEVLQEALDAGIRVVGPAGNGGEDSSSYVPGGIGGVIVAGACDAGGKRLSSSNYGKMVDYYVVSGSTSEASARLAGLLSSANGNVQDAISKNSSIYVADTDYGKGGSLIAASESGKAGNNGAMERDGQNQVSQSDGQGPDSQSDSQESDNSKSSSNGTGTLTDGNNGSSLSQNGDSSGSGDSGISKAQAEAREEAFDAGQSGNPLDLGIGKQIGNMPAFGQGSGLKKASLFHAANSTEFSITSLRLPAGYLHSPFIETSLGDGFCGDLDLPAPAQGAHYAGGYYYGSKAIDYCLYLYEKRKDGDGLFGLGQDYSRLVAMYTVWALREGSVDKVLAKTSSSILQRYVPEYYAECQSYDGSNPEVGEAWIYSPDDSSYQRVFLYWKAQPREEPKASVSTRLQAETGKQYRRAEGGATLTDAVEITGLDTCAGKTLTVEGVLYDKESGNKLLVNGKAVENSVQMQVDGSSVTVKNTFRFDASGLAGKTVVAAEKIFLDGKEIASHEDLQDAAQMVHFPEISTSVRDQETGGRSIPNKGTTVLLDTVTYSNLIPGESYSVEGKLVDRESGQEILGKDGKVLSGSVSFTPEKGNGTVEVPFTVDLSGLSCGGREYLPAGKGMVVFETLKDGDGSILASHEDLDDEGQSVSFLSIKTKAFGQGTGIQNIKASERQTIVDNVSLDGLLPDHEYTIKGKIVLLGEGGSSSKVSSGSSTGNNNTGSAVHGSDNSGASGAGDNGTVRPAAAGIKKLLDKDGNEATASITFRTGQAAAGENTVSQEVELEYTLDASFLAGKTLLCTAELYDGETLLLSHQDADDEDQMVFVPEGSTTLLDDSSKGHEVTSSKGVHLTDTVRYSGLLPETEYEVSGILMDKATGKELLVDGQPVVSTKTFATPKAEEGKRTVSGTVEVPFTFDGSSLEGKELVAFEIVTKNKVEVLEHSDLNSAEQTVRFLSPAPPKETKKASSVVTGDLPGMMVFSILLSIAITSLLFLLLKNKQPHN